MNTKETMTCTMPFRIKAMEVKSNSPKSTKNKVEFFRTKKKRKETTRSPKDGMRITFRDFGFKSTDQLNEIKKQSKSNNKNLQRMNLIKSLQVNKYKSAKYGLKSGNHNEMMRNRYQCNFRNCKYSFVRKSDYNVHVRTHLRLKSVICKKCDKGFVCKKVFKRHKCLAMRKTIDVDQLFICKECGEMFHQKGILYIHKRSHKQTELNKCGLCTKKFILKSTMYKHIMSHVVTFKCQTCYKIFHIPWQFEQHILSHMENLHLHTCLYCRRIFTKQENFEKHITFHARQVKLKEKRGKIPVQQDEQNLLPNEINLSGSSKMFHIGSSTCKNRPDFDTADSLDVESCTRLHVDSPAVYHGNNDDNTDDFSTCFNIDTSNDNFDDKNVGDMPSITKFDCVLCKMSFDNVPAFIQHVNSHEPSGDVRENVGLSRDIRLQGNSKTIYICRCCDKKFTNYDFVKDHLKQVFENESKNLDVQHKQIINEMGGVDVNIDYNKYIFSVSIGNLKSIESSVITKKTVIYHCAKCSTNFKDKQSLLGHVKSCKKEEAKFWCPECYIKFETNKLLKEHIQMGHQKIFTEPMPDLVIVSTEQSQPRQEVKNDTVSCLRCDKTFDTLQEYIEHKNLHNAQGPDTEGDELHCAHCNAVFTSQALLYKHIQNHSRPVKSPSKNNVYCNKMMEDEYTGHWICRICNKAFSTKCNLTRHITLHDESEKKDHHCPFCNRVFQYQRYLQHHIMYMHKSKEEKKHFCTQCGSFFKSLQSLYRHMTLHTGEADLKRNLPCDYCEKRFKCKEELKLHTRTHTGEKPFPCDKCSYRAAAYCNLQKHIQRKHENLNKIDGRRNNGRKKKEVKTEEENEKMGRNDKKLKIKNEREDI